jgi:hypothetical protein
MGRSALLVAMVAAAVVTTGVAVWKLAGTDPRPDPIEWFPAAGATDVPAGVTVDVAFDGGVDVDPAALEFTLRDRTGALVPARVRWEDDRSSASLDPAAGLAPGRYEARIEIRQMDAPYTWTFVVSAAPRLSRGPGGPVLLVTDDRNPYDDFIAEILRAEGMPAFETIALRDLASATLADHAVAVVSGTPRPTARLQLGRWLEAGGRLVLNDAGDELAGLAGLRRVPGAVAEGDLLVDPDSRAGRGVPATPLRLHAEAAGVEVDDRADVVATVQGDGRSFPAVTLREVGPAGGSVAAFTFDLAESVVLTRQGNPRWAGQERDGTPPVRPDDLFFGGSADDPAEDWVDLDQVHVPHADEQMRLLSRLVEQMTAAATPLPRFWYFPDDEDAVLVMAADDHGTEDGTADLFAAMQASDPPGCDVDRWECARATAWLDPGSGLTSEDAADLHDAGFDLGAHVTTGCQDWTETSLREAYLRGLRAFRVRYPDLPAQTGHRLHCIAWTELVTQPEVERDWGIRIDMNYYYWPGDWVASRAGFMTGSGLPLRFSDLDGGLIDVYQQETHLVDEVFAGDPDALRGLVERARGPEGYVAAFGTHHDFSTDFGAEVMEVARDLDVPIISAQQLLDWTDGRSASTVDRLRWSSDSVTFTVTVDERADGRLRALLPTEALGGRLATVERDGEPLELTSREIRGVEYTFFDARSGAYAASYR